MTPRLLLVRHGEAGPAADDRQRPLTDRGRESVERLARQAAGLAIPLAEIRHSGLVRARQTAEILAAALRPASGVREAPGLLPGDDPEDLARAVRAGPAPAQPALVVGHLPHLGRLVSTLVLGRPEPELVRLLPATLVVLGGPAGPADRGWVIECVLPTPGGTGGA
jgi:phosphohistidine phosphatase